MRREELIKGLSGKGLASRGLAEIVSADWLSEDQLRVFFPSESGPEERILSRADKARLEAGRAVRPFSTRRTFVSLPKRAGFGWRICSIPTMRRLARNWRS